MSEDYDLDWLASPGLQILFELIEAENESVRVNGGAVRNALLGEPVNDIDVSTTMAPGDVMALMQGAGHKVVPTGLDHGTVTVVINKQAFEVTTLREDVATDGRHAEVKFGKDWKRDAQRRDFTLNALYMDRHGTLFDPLGGVDDLKARRIRFIDDPDQRIREDYLRILRFFRFFAWYGAFRPDAEGLKACTRLKEGLDHLSVERVWQELSKLFAAPDPGRSVLWMRQTGILTKVLPESEKWGIDALPGVIAAEKKQGWPNDPLLRLMAILPPNADKLRLLAKRLKLSKLVTGRLENWASSAEPDKDMPMTDFQAMLYRGSQQGIIDRLKLAIAQGNGNGHNLGKFLDHAQSWEKPRFPLSGKDILKLGYTPGPKISEILEGAEIRWIEGGFTLDKAELLATIGKQMDEG